MTKQIGCDIINNRCCVSLVSCKRYKGEINTEKAIKTVGLTKKYKDVTAVDGLSLEINEGELFALLGVNGAGKTTTIKILSSVTRPTAGDAIMDGKSVVHDTAEVKSLIGVSPQESAVAPNLSVKENLEMMCGVHGFSKEKTAEKVAELAEKFGLDEVMKRRAGKLSGGWQRRCSIAMALISEPKILFLDEPTVGLDPEERARFKNLIRKLSKTKTIVLSTHILSDVEEVADYIILIKEGCLTKFEKIGGKDNE